jgi:hypothetical protein
MHGFFESENALQNAVGPDSDQNDYRANQPGHPNPLESLADNRF